MNSKKKLLHLLVCSSFLFLILLCGGCKAQDLDYNETTTSSELRTATEEVGSFLSDMWLEGADMMKILWKECSKKIFEKDLKRNQDVMVAALQCVKMKTLKAIDRSLNADVISLSPGVELVKYQQIDKKGRLVSPHNIGNSTENIDLDNNSDWKYAVLDKMAKVFNTHVLKIDVSQEEKNEAVEPRHRRRNQMMQMMMFGILSMGMILVPMGFQFLAVLGGKALLLAKFALILSSIQALKKASASPIGYPFPALQPIHPENAFEKRGYDLPVSDNVENLKSDLEPSQSDHIKSGSIAYMFDHENKVWKPQTKSKVIIKKSDVDLQLDKLYPVYSASQTAPTNNLNENVRPVYAGFKSWMDEDVVSGSKPTEIQAEYTIDLPVEKVQLRTTSPYITSVTQ